MSAALTVSLVWGFLLVYVFSDGPKYGPQKIIIWETDKENIVKAIYKDGKTRVTLEPDWENDFIWVETETPRRTPRRPMQKGKPPGPPKEMVEKKSFKGSSAASTALVYMGRMLADRKLGKLKDLDPKTYKLDKQDNFIEIFLKNEKKSKKLILGRHTVRDGQIYAYFPETGETLLLPGREYRNLAGAHQKFIDRALLPRPLEMAEKIVLNNKGKGLNIEKLKISSTDPERWGKEGEGGPLPGAQDVVNALDKIRLLEYVEDPPGGTPKGELMLEATIFWKEKGLSPVKMRFHTGESAYLLVQSSYNRKWVKVQSSRGNPFISTAVKLINRL